LLVGGRGIGGGDERHDSDEEKLVDRGSDEERVGGGRGDVEKPVCRGGDDEKFVLAGSDDERIVCFGGEDEKFDCSGVVGAEVGGVKPTIEIGVGGSEPKGDD